MSTATMSTATMSPPRKTTNSRRRSIAFNNTAAPSADPLDSEAAFVLFKLKSPKFAAIDMLSEMSDDISWHDIFYWMQICEDLHTPEDVIVYSQEEMDLEFEARWRRK